MKAISYYSTAPKNEFELIEAALRQTKFKESRSNFEEFIKLAWPRGGIYKGHNHWRVWPVAVDTESSIFIDLTKAS